MSNAPDLTPSVAEGLPTVGKPRKGGRSITPRTFDPVPRPDGGSSALYCVINALIAAGMDLPDPHMLAHLSEARAVSGVVRDLHGHGWPEMLVVEGEHIAAHVATRGPVVYAKGHDVFTLVSVTDDGALVGLDPLGRTTAVEPDSDGFAVLIPLRGGAE